MTAILVFMNIHLGRMMFALVFKKIHLLAKMTALISVNIHLGNNNYHLEKHIGVFLLFLK